MSHRKQQIESTLHRAVSQALAARLSDPRLEGAMVSVTRVELTTDLKEASVLVSVVPEQRQALALAALQHAAGRVAGEIRKAITMRTMPRLHFKVDGTLKNQDRVYDAIAEGAGRPPVPGQGPQEAPPAADSGQETAP